MRFDSVLVANRGEIAVRVLRTARAQGYRTIAVFSDADADAPHVDAADVAVRIGPSPVGESYLDIDRIIDAAKRTGAQAVHPGYGFLSENADFAQACADAALVFIGPTPEVIRLMGDKSAAKRRMAIAGLPMLPGYQGEEQGDDCFAAEAARIGYPVMVKAAAGGGGKGMRLVTTAADLEEALASARRESIRAFGSEVLILERAVARPRHVEVQVLGDEHGHVLALGERDCSVQRRHQKVIEEAPSPALDPCLRDKMSTAAIGAAAEIGYVGVGTVEFILDQGGDFAFLEMNTRLQVEHPVTELVTGLDLVDWQLRVAQGEQLTVTQAEVRLDGHAIEARLYAEDPSNGFLPDTGTIEAWQAPSGEGIRVDTGITTGTVISAHYDPMLAKIIAHGRDRDEARRRLIAALENTVTLGVATNRSFLLELLRVPEFTEGRATTALISETPIPRTEPTCCHLATAAALLHKENERVAALRSPGLAGWSNAASLRTTQQLAVGDEVTEVVLHRNDHSVCVQVRGEQHIFEVDHEPLRLDGLTVDHHASHPRSGRVLIRFADLDLDASDVLLAPPAPPTASGTGVRSAPMHGSVTTVIAALGSHVDVGDRLLVLEAMKMEHPVCADVTGCVTEIASVGQQVAAGDILARIAPDQPNPKQEGL